MREINIQKSDVGEAVKQAADCLMSGEILVVPTDTVYGLACGAKNKEAVEKVFTIKTRETVKGLPVFISSFEMLDDVAYVKDERVMEFLRAKWPGALTAVLPARGWMPLELRGGELNIGVRMPDYPLVLDIIREFGEPITGTSANLSGSPASGKIEEVLSQFRRVPFKPDLVLNAGDLPDSEPSTVVDCTVWPPKVLREGAVKSSELRIN